MDVVEMELPSRTETVEVWGDGGNGEDSGVEVVRPASCGSSVLSGYSEQGSECGSETYTPDSSKAQLDRLGKPHDVSETGSESSFNQDGAPNKTRPTLPSRKPTAAETRVRDARTRAAASARADTKPKVPAKPPTLKATARARKSEGPRVKPDDNDGRWPFAASQKSGSRSRATSAADPGRKSAVHNLSTSMHHSMTQSFTTASAGLRVDATALEKYGTLPRRKKKDGIDISPGMTRSNSREPSLNRAATLRRQTSKEKDTPATTPSPTKSLPPYPRGRKPATRTLILHEVSVQTSLTGSDLQRTVPQRLSGDTSNQEVQTEGDERLLNGEEVENLRKTHQCALRRIQTVLGLDDSREPTMDLLHDLERHVAVVGRTVVKQRDEIHTLKSSRVSVQKELERALAAYKVLQTQHQSLEVEQSELQEFLQTEKSTLSESLIDADDEISRLKEMVQAKDEELSEQQEQCKHLVRLCEQRRQENLSLEARLAGLEQRSCDVLRQQGAAVSGAAVALTSLGSRLDGLVEQLALSYDVSEKDLEDVIFHNEAYSQSPSAGSPEPTPDNTGVLNPKPRKRASSFLSAVLGAIRSATQSPNLSSGAQNSLPLTPPDQSSGSLGLFDTELTLDPLSRSSDSYLENLPEASSSLHNLSAAILKRQKTEEEEEAYRSLEPGLPPDLSSLVDQVIQVDNLVTKLLKVIRIVHIDNDACLDQLADQRTDLEERLRIETTYRQDAEVRLGCVEKELQDARNLVAARIQELEKAKQLLADNWRRESERQYATIDHALETLQGIQDVVDQYPPLGKLQQQLEDCNFRTAAGDDLNANSPNGCTAINNGTTEI